MLVQCEGIPVPPLHCIIIKSGLSVWGTVGKLW